MLKITRLETFVIGDGPDVDPDKGGIGPLACLRVHTDGGLIGFSEVFRVPPGVVKATVGGPDTHFGRLLIGQQVTHPERLWQHVWDSLIHTNRRGWEIIILGALDVAIWDVYGQSLGQPVWQLLGGVHRGPFQTHSETRKTSVVPYCTLVSDVWGGEPMFAQQVERAERLAALGYRAFKVEPMMHSGHLAANQRQWLIDMVKGAQGRRVILLSHHQPFHFTKSENSELTTGLQPVWDTGNVDFWFWGHQHAGVRYDQSPFGFRGRCVGHGGIPELRPTEVRTSGVSRPTGHADYAWKGITTPVASHDVQAWIIDGPNPLVSQDPDFSPHGWAVLELDAESATERWYVASDDSFEVTLP